MRNVAALAVFIRFIDILDSGLLFWATLYIVYFARVMRSDF